ncbi:MAG: alpha/beta hydrolase [Alphaproteobacteria bacterium]|nr:alpha/beta hydrolase [Alphaproteobacteria bacterium]
MSITKFESTADGTSIAYLEDGGEDIGRCGLFWLGGFRSDMRGGKAESLGALARETRRTMFRFDYSGHGESGGFFVDGTISLWLSQAIHMFTKKSTGRQIVIGSSMGGWLAMLLYRFLQQRNFHAARRVAGLVLIAPAADFTSDLMWKTFSPDIKAELAEKGVYMRPSLYGDPYPITAKLITDGDDHLMLKDGIDCHCPVRIIQGDSDPDVPPSHAMRVFECLRGGDVTITLVKGGDHRLSTPGHIELIRETALRLAERADGISL